MKYCLSTVIYPEMEKYLDEFIDSVQRLNKKLDLIVFNHAMDIKFPNITTVNIDPKCSIALVRSKMFYYLKQQTKYDIYLFIDSDDIIHKDAVKNHTIALKNSDFSYGDQLLFRDGFNNNLQTTLFSFMNPPDILEKPTDLLHGNCVGLSALALSRKALIGVPEKFPEELQPLDWWLTIKLLEAGMTGARANVVTYYRLSSDADYNLCRSKNIVDLKNKVKIVHKLLSNITESQTVKILKTRLENLLQLIENDNAFIEKSMKKVSEKKMMWYQDVFDILDIIEQKPTKGKSDT